MSVGTLLGTPSAQGLFHRAILQSGAADNVSTPEQGIAVAERFLAELGVEPRDAGALRPKRVSEILNAQRVTAFDLGMVLGLLPWQPCVDGEVLPRAPLAEIERGTSGSVPVLIGTNAREWRLFMLGDRKGRSLDEAGLRRRLARALPGKDADGRAHAELAFDAYSQGERGSSPSALWEAFQSDRIFNHPARRLATAHSAHRANGRQTYSYLFGWSPPLVGGRIGACHGIEIPFVFGTLRDPLLRPVFGITRGALALSARMQDAWIAFAQHGDPACEALPEWPAYDAQRRATMRLGAECGSDEAPFGRELRFWEELERG